MTLSGCSATGSSGSGSAPPPPPPVVTVSVAPLTGSVLLGKTLLFTATVSGTNNAAVTWSVNGISGGRGSAGVISAAGLYTAPADLPLPASVQITATSVASPASSASAQVTVTSDISVGVSPATASVELGASRNFVATVTSAGSPDATVRWTLSGGACPSACGSLDSAGNYTAPQTLPSPATVVVSAQSVADPSKQASISLAITSDFTLRLSAPSSLPSSTTTTIVATLTPVPGSNPSSVLSWSLTGTGCTGAACGTLSTVTTEVVGAGASGTDTEKANYTAPGAAPVPDTIVVTATPLADPSKAAQATIAVGGGVGISLTPATATLAVNRRATFAVGVTGSTNSGVNWSVNGVPAGNGTLGQVCVTGSSPCSPISTSAAAQIDYVAPAALPLANPVTVQATSVAHPTKTATAQVTILNHVVVSVLPGNVTLAPGALQSFTASVLGTTNQSVLWQIEGPGCDSLGVCGAISAAGTYTAPGTPPSPNAFEVVAISSDDTTQSGSANVTVSSGANLEALHPASVYAGGAAGFLLRADGGGFVATAPGPGSTLLIGGTARTTNCSTAADCTTAVSPVDVATPGNVSVQIQNPDGSLSNILSLVVAARNVRDDTVTLTGAAPAATGKDIVVVQPTTAGVSVPGDNVDLNIAALGNFSAGTNTCSLGGTPIVLTRPATAAALFEVCAFSQSGLDTSMAYTVSGISDVSVVAKQPLGLGIVHLTLQVQATAQPGARTLFIQNLNLDKTAASGVFEVQ